MLVPLVTNPIIGLTGGLVEPFLHFVQSPLGIIAFSESLPEMFFSFLSSSGLLHTLWALWESVLMTLNLGREVMMAIPL